MNKYRLLETDTKIVLGHKLYRIQACKSFGGIKENDLGGYIENEVNLSQEGDAWVYGNAEVSGDAWVYGNAEVSGDAWVYGNAEVSGNARVSGNAEVYGNAWVYGDAKVFDNAKVYGDARVSDNAVVKHNGDYLCIKGIGSHYRNTTAYKVKRSVEINCGCFHGTLEEFEDRVKQTHADTKFAKEYELFIEIIKLHFGDAL